MTGDSLPADPSDRRRATRAAAPFRVAGWTAVPRAHELVRPGETIRLEPKPMEVLAVLAARAGEAVSREELMEAVWPDVVVTEHALNRCVSQLRRALADDARAPTVIETIPKAGYRLVAPVEWLSDGSTAPLEAVDVRVAWAPPPDASTDASASRDASGVSSRRRRWVVALGVGALAVGVAALVVGAPRRAPETRPLTVERGVEQQAAWSPDGARVAYVHADSGGGGRVMVRAVGADLPRALTDGPADASPAWSPDGARVAFLRCDPPRPPAPPACAAFVVDADGGPARRLASERLVGAGLAWGADGLVGVAAAPGGRSRLVRLDPSTGAVRPLTDPPAGASDLWPARSPDGRTVAFLRRAGGAGDLHVVPVAGGEARRLTEQGGPFAGHAWAPDGRSVVFSSARSGYYGLWRVPAGGGDVRPVVGAAVRDPGGPALSAGGRMVVEDWAFDLGLWRSTDGAPFAPVVTSSLWNRQPHLWPDGRRVAFVSARTGVPEVWTADADGGRLTRLTHLAAHAAHPRVSPDGRSVAFLAWADGAHHLHVAAADGGPPRRLAPADGPPRWTRDGRALLVGRRDGARWSVWRVPADGRAPRRVADGMVAEETPDGALLVARADAPGLWRDGRRVADVPAAGDAASWAVTTAGVVVLDRPRARLVRLDARTGAATPLAPAPGRTLTGEAALTASADGRVLVVARVERVEADLLLVDGAR